MKKAIWAVLVVLLSGCAGGKSLNFGACDGLKGAKVASTEYAQAAKVCKDELTRRDVDPCVATEQASAHTWKHYKEYGNLGWKPIQEAKDEIKARCMEHSYYNDPCQDFPFYRKALDVANRSGADFKGSDMVDLWRKKEDMAYKACEKKDNGSDSVVFGFTTEYNNRCSEHNGQFSYRNVKRACVGVTPEAESAIKEILGGKTRYNIGAAQSKGCEDAKKQFYSWFNGCGGTRKGTDPFKPKSGAQLNDQDASRLQKENADLEKQLKELKEAR